MNAFNWESAIEPSSPTFEINVRRQVEVEKMHKLEVLVEMISTGWAPTDAPPASIANGDAKTIPRSILTRSAQYGHALMLKDRIYDKGSGPIYHNMPASYYTVLLKDDPGLLRALADANPTNFAHEQFLLMIRDGTVPPVLALGPPPPLLAIEDEEEEREVDAVAVPVPPVPPLPPDVANAVHRDMTLVLSGGEHLEIKFSYSHSSGNIRGWCTCPCDRHRAERCAKWRQVNQFRNERHLAAWLYEWALLPSRDENLTVNKHVYVAVPTDRAVEDRLTNMPFL